MVSAETPQQKLVLSAAPATLAIYMHWPFCKSKCPYCDFNSHVRDQVDQNGWKQAMRTELRHMAAWLPGRTVTSIFIGGGTPSLMPPDTLAALLSDVAGLWPMSDDIEITMEANPTSVEAELFRAFREAGVNRVSLGVQSLYAEELAFLGREHSAGEAMNAIELAAGIFPRYSFDLIYARPNQTVAAWEKELGEALTLCKDHLSVYQLTIEEGTAFHHHYQQKKFALPDEDTAAELYQLTQNMLDAKGMPAYEISNHATPGHASRHNLAYWHYDDYLGVGPGAHGRVSINGKRYATETLKSPERWIEQVRRESHGISVKDDIAPRVQAEECVMMGLRLMEGLNAEHFQTRIGLPLLDVIDAQALAELQTHGLLTWNPPYLKATPRGQLLLNTVTGKLLR